MPDFSRGAEKSTPLKVALRKHIITLRQSLPESLLQSSAAAIQNHLGSLLPTLISPPPAPPDAPPGRPSPSAPAPDALSARTAAHTAPGGPSRTGEPVTIAAYVPIGSEPGGPGLPEFLAAALPPDGRLLLPVLLEDGDLDWARYDGPASLSTGPRGLREPVGQRLGVDAIRAALLVVVPALAVDTAGRRLGRGGGSYDRALARVSSALTVALLHDGELVDAVPAEKHDQPVGAAITPRSGVTLRADPDWTK